MTQEKNAEKVDNLMDRLDSIETIVANRRSELIDKIKDRPRDATDLKAGAATFNTAVFDDRPTNMVASTGKGSFESGGASKDAKHRREPLTIEEMEESVDETQFNCKLIWATPTIQPDLEPNFTPPEGL